MTFIINKIALIQLSIHLLSLLFLYKIANNLKIIVRYPYDNIQKEIIFCYLTVN